MKKSNLHGLELLSRLHVPPARLADDEAADFLQPLGAFLTRKTNCLLAIIALLDIINLVGASLANQSLT